ncbi:MAG TPA: thioredoxin fold domain-containing protein [Burkholderiales bacterium]|nr:thioredoxin fold domain-containing protein [Burkholderiales bacterium]
MRLLFLLALLLSLPARAQEAPEWFAQSLLHLPDDVAEAAREGKRVMLYFGQPGCPYCKQLMEVNFRQRPIAERMQKEFVSIELSIFGDRDVTWTDGHGTTEKRLAAELKVQYTPTLVFLDEKGAVAYRVNGYYAPPRFLAALDQAWGRAPSPTARGGKAEITDEPFFLALKDLRRQKPLAVLFETPYCAECDGLHAAALRHPAVRAELAKYDVVRFALSSTDVITTPGGRQAKVADWARSLKIDYVPTIVLFDAGGTERLRMEAYFRAFHVAGSLAYVSSGAWRREPSLQRFLQARGDELRRQGKPVNLWD